MTDAKKALRMQASELLQSLPEEYIRFSDMGIFERLISLPEFVSAGRVFAYFSSGREANTKELIARAIAMGKPAALPVTLGGGKMRFAPYGGNEAELTGRFYGIPQPAAGSPVITPRFGDIMIVPALRFDRRGFRLGHGGGYYDRFLAGCPAFTVGLCRERLIYDGALPSEAHDIRVSCVVTESEVTRLI